MRIRSQLLAYFALIALVPLYIAAWLAIRSLEENRARHEDESLLERATEMGGYVDAYFDSTLENLRADARLPLFSSFLNAAPAQRAAQTPQMLSLLRNVVSRDVVHMGSAALLDEEGRNIADTALDNAGALEANAIWVRQARYSGLGSVVGPLLDHKANASLHAIQPIRDAAGKIVGFLRVSSSSARLQQLIRSKARYSNVFAMLFDAEGVVLAHGAQPALQSRAMLGGDPQLIERLRAELRLPRDVSPLRLSDELPALSSGMGWIRWQNNAEADHDRFALVPVRGMQWRLMLVEPAASYGSARNKARTAAVSIAILISVLVLGAAWLAARRIALPIVKLTEAADSLALVEGASLSLPIAASGEIGRLARALRNMTMRLQDALSEQRTRIDELRHTEERLRTSETRFSELFHLSPVPLLLTRRGRREIVDLNAICEWVFCLQRGRVIGKPLTEAGIGVCEDDFVLAQDLLDHGKDVDLVMSMHTAHGENSGRFRVFARAFDAADDGWAVWTFVDVTEAEHSRHALEELNATLEERVAQRTAELAQALERLQMAQEELVRSEKLGALANLVAGVAHELNTPIGNCVIVASTLQQMSSDLSRDMASQSMRRSTLDAYVGNVGEAAAMLESNLGRAHALVTSFKQVSVDQVSENRRRFDLSEMLGEVIATLSPILRNTPWQLSTKVEPGLDMDSFPGALGQVLTNFVTNAVAHAFEGRMQGSIQIRAWRRGADEVELVCEDDGVGIPTDLIKRVFDPFFTTKLGRGGSGLGLHIVYNLVTVTLGGRIEVHSTPGTGARFRIVIPRKAPTQQQDQA